MNLSSAPMHHSAAAPLTPDALPVGMPLAWPVVDVDGTLLLAPGEILASDSERAFFFEHFEPCRGDTLAPVASDAPPAPASTGDMRLTVGASMGLRKLTSSSSHMQPCRLIGAAPGGALFVTPPGSDRHALALPVGENVETVAIASHAVFRFICTVEAVCLSPFEYVVLSPPAAIRCLRQRRSIRVNAKIPVHYSTGENGNGSGHDGIALAKGISPTGLSLTAPWRLGDIGERVRLAFRLRSAGLDAPIETAAIIRNLQQSRDDGGRAITHGLELDRLTPSEQIAMKAYVFDRHEHPMDWSAVTK